jgi:hypothetical protein
MNQPTEYAGIDYGLGLSNIDHATGIRYGVISQHAVGQAWYDDSEADYGDPACPECGNAIRESTDADAELDQYGPYGCADYTCDTCAHTLDSADVYGEEPIGFAFQDTEYTLTAGSDGDIFVIKSPYYTHAQFCSPCAPGAGHLENPCETGPRTYCLGHEWFEEGTAPYPVFRVSDDTPVTE